MKCNSKQQDCMILLIANDISEEKLSLNLFICKMYQNDLACDIHFRL